MNPKLILVLANSLVDLIDQSGANAHETQQALRIVGDLLNPSVSKQSVPPSATIDAMSELIEAAREFKQTHFNKYPNFNVQKYALGMSAKEEAKCPKA